MDRFSYVPVDTEDWDEILESAPHFCESLKLISKASFPSPDPLDLPQCLGLRNRSEFKSTRHWESYLSESESEGVSNRELYLRVLLVYAVSDQGAHIPGVRVFMQRFIQSSYELGIRFFHDSQAIGDSRLVKLAKLASDEAADEYAEEWAVGRRLSAKSYSVFTIDQIGRLSTNAYVNARISPALWLPHLVGGLEENFRKIRSLSKFKSFIKSDNHHGLKNAIGDKALGLYLKWVYHSFRLIRPMARLTSPMLTPESLAIPMDQRIGRVLMRCGFMDEFFGMAWCFENQNERFPMFSEGDSIARLEGGHPPKRKVHLRVTNFRSQGRMYEGLLFEILQRRKRSMFYHNTALNPQNAISILLQLISRVNRKPYYPGDFDDALMNIAEICTDSEPDCQRCLISSTCQANNGSEYLKDYHT